MNSSRFLQAGTFSQGFVQIIGSTLMEFSFGMSEIAQWNTDHPIFLTRTYFPEETVSACPFMYYIMKCS